MDTVKKRYLMLFNCILLAIGANGGPLLLRLYFIHGGKRIWLSSALGTAGWPILLLPLSLSYIFENDRDKICAFIGLLMGLNDYLYSRGVSLFPVSTSTLIMSTHLAFTAGFAFVIVKQNFTLNSVNAIVLLTVGAVLLGLHSNGDKPVNESNKDYYLGFFLKVGASNHGNTCFLVIEMQTVTAVVASFFCIVRMHVNDDFKVYFVGTAGVIFCSTSLLAGVITAIILPVREILSVVFYHESFKSEKAIALFLSISYLYGGYNFKSQ
ncbi:hypothetical protein MKX01_001692 [Papaver californicum]|nr:hypothetical protein MKX01_001692 [Papaver californicum]